MRYIIFFLIIWVYSLQITLRISYIMTKTKPETHRPREQQRFEREARALQKNLEKRKAQQAMREQLQKENDHGQDKD